MSNFHFFCLIFGVSIFFRYLLVDNQNSFLLKFSLVFLIKQNILNQQNPKVSIEQFRFVVTKTQSHKRKIVALAPKDKKNEIISKRWPNIPTISIPYFKLPTPIFSGKVNTKRLRRPSRFRVSNFLYFKTNALFRIVNEINKTRI